LSLAGIVERSPLETPTALVALSSDGIVNVRIRAGVRQSLEDARANLSAALETRGGQRRPLLVDIREAVPLDADVRRHYSGHVLVGFTAMALLTRASPLGRMIGNVYLRVANTRIPTRLFTDESAAREWLRN
jgi:hypothetical protein